jgi:hypothetical protein
MTDTKNSQLPGSIETLIETTVTDVATTILTGPPGPTGPIGHPGLFGLSGVTGSVINNADLNQVSKLHLDKYLTFVINPDIKQVVTILTTDSAAVQDIVNMLDLILADGKIDLSDAPILLALVKKIITLRTSDLKLSQNLTLDHFLSIIKLVFTILAKEGVLKIANTDEFITDITKLIDLMEQGDKIAETMSCCIPLTALIFRKK